MAIQPRFDLSENSLDSSNVNLTGETMCLRWFFTLLTTDSHSPPKCGDPSGMYFHSTLWQLQNSEMAPCDLIRKEGVELFQLPVRTQKVKTSVMDILVWQQIDVRQRWRFQMLGQILTPGESPLSLDTQIGRCWLSELLVSLLGHTWFETGQRSQHQRCEILRLGLLCLEVVAPSVDPLVWQCGA